MTLKRGVRQLVEDATARIETMSVETAKSLTGDPGVLFVDIRETRELERDGTIPGTFHAPRGMIEFWVDPDSPYFKAALGGDKTLVLFCASAWRSALATAQLKDMGVENVCQLEGGFTAWKNAGGAVAAWDSKAHRSVARD